MKPGKLTLLAPIALITVGIGWLLTVQEVYPEIDWIWTLSLAALGLSAFILAGFNKATVVAGPFFLLSAVLSVLRQTGVIGFDVLIPLLVIVVGVLLLIARTSAVPVPSWLREDAKPNRNPPSGS